MKKILLPTDLSDLGNFAYDIANKVATALGAEIEVLSIIAAPPRAFFDHNGQLKEDEGEDYTDWYAKRDELEKQMDEWSAHKPDISKTTVKIGRVQDDILDYVKENDIDLVVMGTAGALGMDEMLRGSNAEHIVRNSPVPVLTLKCDRSDINFDDLLMVSDFKDAEPLKLDVIKSLQNAFGANLNLLKINTKEDFETNREIHARMESFVETNDLKDVKYHIYCDESVEQGIVSFCAESGIDFMAIGTHQRSGFSRLFKSSLSEEVINHIYQPILAFPV